MIHELEDETLEFADSGEFESEFEAFEEAGEYDNEIRIGDRSGFTESESPFESELETGIFPPKELLPVVDTTKTPYRLICQVLVGMKSANGKVGTQYVSGTLISNRHVLTCGHALRDDDGKGVIFDATRILVTPGKNTSLAKKGDWKPFGSYEAKSWKAPGAWTNYFDPYFDYGLITLKTDLGKKKFRAIRNTPFGYWGGIDRTLLKEVDPVLLEDKEVHCGGYPNNYCGVAAHDPATATRPCEKGRWGGTMFYSRDKILDPRPRQEHPLLYHRADVMVGMSGGPVWRWDKFNHYLVAVQTRGKLDTAATPRNRGVRITKKVLDDLKAMGWST